MADSTAEKEMRDGYYEWVGEFLMYLLGFLPVGGLAVCYAYKHTSLHNNAPNTNIYLGFYSGIGFVFTFIGKVLRDGFLVDICWTVACICTCTFVSTAISQAYTPNTEKYYLVGGILIIGTVCLTTIVRSHRIVHKIQIALSPFLSPRRNLLNGITHLPKTQHAEIPQQPPQPPPQQQTTSVSNHFLSATIVTPLRTNFKKFISRFKTSQQQQQQTESQSSSSRRDEEDQEQQQQQIESPVRHDADEENQLNPPKKTPSAGPQDEAEEKPLHNNITLPISANDKGDD